jgi:hypothetical protein
MSITVHMPNEKVAKAFLAAKPDNVSAKGVTVKVAKKGKRLGVMSITKAENAQLGLILKYIHEDKDALPEDVLRYPEALSKLMSRYS